VGERFLSFAWVGSDWAALWVGLAGFLVGSVTCFVMLVSEWGAWALIMPGRRLNGSKGEGEPAREIQVEPITATARDGTHLEGDWYPGPPGAQRTIFLIHGFAEIRDAMKGRAEYLVGQGWNVVRLDMRGYGRSGGDRASFGGREGEDLRAWLDVVEGRLGPGVFPTVWGRSMGAAIALRGAVLDARIRALILESPYARLETVVAGWLRRVGLPRVLALVLAPRIVRRARRLAGVSLSRPSPAELASRVSMPVLVLHGKQDSLVPEGDAQRMIAAVPAGAESVEVEGAGHGNVVEVGGPPLLARIAHFLDQSALGSNEVREPAVRP